MPSFQSEPLSASKMIRLKELLACDEIRILKMVSGGNSKVFCVEAQCKKWAVKSYPPYAPNQRNRLAAEYKAYQFLNEHQINAVPRVTSLSFKERWLVMDWVEGSLPFHYSNVDIEQAITFIQRVAQLSTLQAAKTLPDAAEACFSLATLIRQIMGRFERIYAISLSANEPALQTFLLKAFAPLFEKYKQEAEAHYLKHQMNPYDKLSDRYCSLIPADFGFHNTLRNKKGLLYFFDFDYFGWDDPVKLLADIIWHPKVYLSLFQKQQFIDGLARVYGSDPLFLNRFRYTLSLFGLRWVLILLNEFIPAFWKNRQHAEVHHNEIEAKKRQLERAISLLKVVQQTGYNHELDYTSIV